MYLVRWYLALVIINREAIPYAQLQVDVIVLLFQEILYGVLMKPEIFW